ncbi:MAG: sporulation integral membrane protein YtvI [Defluviitaleaceae bacterium]|nr:sporulation integral membrane protein YtvI [Defluviitaleaceae bacterium]
MKSLYIENKAFFDKLLILLAFYVIGYVFLVHLLAYVAPFVIGFLLSAIISPLVGFLQRKLKIARSITTILLISVIIALVAIAATALFNRIVMEAGNLAETLPTMMEDVNEFIHGMEDSFDRFLNFIPDGFAPDFNELIGGAVASITAGLGDFVMAASVGFVRGIPLMLMSVFLCLISAFFFTKDKKLISESITKSLPPPLSARISAFRRGLLTAIGGYVRAQLTIMTVIFAISVLGLVILGHPYAVILGLVIALADTLPMIGTGLVFWPYAVISFISGNHSFAIGLLIINVVCFLARQLLEPKVLGQQIGLHPLLVLLGVYVGVNVFGFIGLFLGPLFMVMSKMILSQGSDKADRKEERSKRERKNTKDK